MLDHAHMTQEYLCGCQQASLVLRSESPFYLYYEDADRFCYRLHKPTNVLYVQSKVSGEWQRYSYLGDLDG